MSRGRYFSCDEALALLMNEEQSEFCGEESDEENSDGAEATSADAGMTETDGDDIETVIVPRTKNLITLLCF